MKKVIVFILTVIFLLSLTITGGAQEPIKIGALFALTGGLAPFGPPIVSGAKLAVEQVNKAGGILGRRLELVIRDTATAPAVGLDAASKLIHLDRVVAIIGALSSGVTFASSSVTIPARIVLISPASTSPMLTDLEDDDFVFRTVLSDAFQGVVQGKLALDLGYKTASVIYVNNPYGKGLAEVFKNEFEAGGGQVLAMVPYEENKPSYRGEVEKAIVGAPAAINLIAYPVDGNKVLVQAVELGYEGTYIFSDGMKGEDVAGGPAADYIVGTLGTAPGPMEVEVAEAFEKDYNEAFGPTTVPYNDTCYDALALIALAIKRVGPSFLDMTQEQQGTAIRDNLRAVANPPGEIVTYNEFARAFKLLEEGKDINYEGVSGPIIFDEHGDTIAGAIEIWQNFEGRARTVRIVEVRAE
ncbi:ABC transporter substrate-binding protein [Candidatus Aerophobetes bacterium]|nr:ABC transporter substrate-binding protein [Candidatus Aerophobetes bacterium]